MKRRFGLPILPGIILLSLSLLLSSCGGGGGGGGAQSSASTQNGIVSLAITDAPGLDFDHVWITVKEVWFHTSDAAGPDESGWLKYPLASPMTVDLVALTNGNLTNISSGFTLPAGNYQQIRLFLASTDDALVVNPNPPSGQVPLKHNNEVDLQVNGNSYQAPLRILSPAQGIALPGSFQVPNGGTLRLVIDFDVGNDVVKTIGGLNPEFILKPRLKYFNLGSAGAIAGAIDPGVIRSASVPNGGFNFVIHAEESDGDYYVVRRSTTIKSDGTFVLYPLAADPDGKTYDIVLRGRNVDTVIIKSVPVYQGTTPHNNPTNIGPAFVEEQFSNEILMNYNNTEFSANLSGPVRPTGSWVNFYQTLPGETIPYEIRYRHLNPYTGQFADAIELSTGRIYVGTYGPDPGIFLEAKTPLEGLGGYKVTFEALHFARTSGSNLTGTAGQQNVPISPAILPVKQGLSANTLAGTLRVPFQRLDLDTGYILACRNGVIVDAINAGASGTKTMSNGGPYSFTLPGGSASSVLRGAFYTVHAIGWRDGAMATTLSAGFPRIGNLRRGDDTDVDIYMFKLWP